MIRPPRPHHSGSDISRPWTTERYGTCLPLCNSDIILVVLVCGRASFSPRRRNWKPRFSHSDRQHPNRNESLTSASVILSRSAMGVLTRCLPTNLSLAWIAASNSLSPPASKSSTPKRVSRTSRAVARIAAQRARRAAVDPQAPAAAASAAAVAAPHARCSEPRARAAEGRPKCRSNPAATSPSTAATASSSSGARTNRATALNERAGLHGRLFALYRKQLR